MKTEHSIYFKPSTDMKQIKDSSIDLIVTSPPYPMIEMWDDSFCESNPNIAHSLEIGDGSKAFDLMHRQLDSVWRECIRVICQGGFLCINIGDATRKVKNNFRLYSNHSRIISFCESIGFQSLPIILWRKQTNSPNKFMGSGMLPSGAYVSLEHEYILILRKGSKRPFTKQRSEKRRKSAFFWEERNTWFSDLWDLKGARQVLPSNEARSRSAAYPIEIVHRLINMYSMQGDMVLDPFCGTGTTTAACILNGRNSIGFEILEGFTPIIRQAVETMGRMANDMIIKRIEAHQEFVKRYETNRGKPLSYRNETYGFPVMTKQEIELQLLGLDSLFETKDLHFLAEHSVAEIQSDNRNTKIAIKSSEKETDQLLMSFGT